MQKILITGGAGFIGFHLAQHLLKGDTRIVLVDNLFRGRPDNDFKKLIAHPHLRFLRLDLTDGRAMKKLGSGYDQVYHLAAINGTDLFYSMPHEVLRINSLALLHVLDWFRSKNPEGKFCFPSSNEAYAGVHNYLEQLPFPTPESVPLMIENPYNARWSYAGTKILGELCVIHYAEQYRFRALIARPHNFYGPRAGYHHVIPQFAQRILKRTDPFPIQGNLSRSFCYIDDAVRAMVLLMDSPTTDTHPVEIVHIGSADEITMRTLAETLFAVAGWTPKRLEINAAPEGSVGRRVPDISKVKKLVGWEPQTTLRNGLAATFAWYKNNPQ